MRELDHVLSPPDVVDRILFPAFGWRFVDGGIHRYPERKIQADEIAAAGAQTWQALRLLSTGG